MEADRSLLFGVLALQAGLIDADQFAEACTVCSKPRMPFPLVDILKERGWIAPADVAHIEYLLERNLQKHGGDLVATLADVPDDMKRRLASIDDAELHRTLVTLGQLTESEIDLPETIELLPERRRRYKITRLHETGGIGRIWKAWDPDLRRDVALKELRPERANSVTHCSRFLKEAWITGHLQHPGIVPIYELDRGPNGQEPFYTMRFVNGQTLTEAVRTFHRKRDAGEAIR